MDLIFQKDDLLFLIVIQMSKQDIARHGFLQRFLRLIVFGNNLQLEEVEELHRLSRNTSKVLTFFS